MKECIKRQFSQGDVPTPLKRRVAILEAWIDMGLPAGGHVSC
jgi:hypothetical protein